MMTDDVTDDPSRSGGNKVKNLMAFLKGRDFCLFQITHIDIEQSSGALTKQAPQVPHDRRNAWWRGWFLRESWRDDKSPAILTGAPRG